MKHLLTILYASSWLSWFSAGMLGPIYAIFVEEIGGDILTAGIAWAVFSLVMGLLTIVMGEFEERKFDRRKAVLTGYVILTGATIGYLFVENPAELLIVQAFIGVGAAINYPAWDALFTHAVDKDKETVEWATQEGGGQIIGGLAALVGGFIASIYGFRTLFVIMACIQGFSILVASHLFLKQNRHLKHARKHR